MARLPLHSRPAMGGKCHKGGTMSSVTGTRRAAISVALAILAVGASSARAIEQSGEQKNMRLVAHLGLQGRGSYQPNVITYPDGRTIIFAGTHAGSAPNPLNGGVVELNGTFIIDATDPRHAVEKFHIPGTGGDSQMVRMCLGSDLPGGMPRHVYMLRNFNAGY